MLSWLGEKGALNAARAGRPARRAVSGRGSGVRTLVGGLMIQQFHGDLSLGEVHSGRCPEGLEFQVN